MSGRWEPCDCDVKCLADHRVIEVSLPVPDEWVATPPPEPSSEWDKVGPVEKAMPVNP